MSASEAIKFWVGKIVSAANSEDVPKELKMFLKIASPFLTIALKKLDNLSNEDATKIIDAIHSLSFKLESQTGIENPYFFDDE